MEKWNFDYLFSGEGEQQMEKQTAFVHGLKGIIKERQRDLAELVLRLDPAQEFAYARVKEAEDALTALRRDPRIEKLRRQELEKLTREAVNEMFRSKE